MAIRSKRTHIRELPLSGTEPLLNMNVWADPRVIKTHNCYAFSLNDLVHTGADVPKQQPGDAAGISNKRGNKPISLSNCDIAKRVLADNPGNIYRAAAETPCGTGFHKIFMFNDPNPEHSDFHFYRQVKDVVYHLKANDTSASVARKFNIPMRQVVSLGGGRLYLHNVNVFSHKMGFATPALLTDSCGKIIKDPRKACRRSGERNYTLHCGSFCVRSGRVTSRAR